MTDAYRSSPLHSAIAHLLNIALENMQRPYAVSVAASGVLFERRLSLELDKLLDARSRSDLDVVRRHCREAVRSARRGMQSRGMSSLQRAGQLIHEEPVDLKVLLSWSFIESAGAYCDLRDGNISKAQRRLSSAISIDASIEHAYGLRIMHLHRLQAIHNWLRILLRQREFEAARILCFETLGYLAREPIQPSVGREWNANVLQELDERLLEAVRAQFIAELVVIHGGASRKQREYVIQGCLTLARHSSKSLELAGLWAICKASLHKDSAEGYIASALGILIKPPPGDAALMMWADVAVDVCRFAETRGLMDCIPSALGSPAAAGGRPFLAFRGAFSQRAVT